MRSSCSTRSAKRELKSIVEIQLDRVRARLADRRITLEISDEAKTPPRARSATSRRTVRGRSSARSSAKWKRRSAARSSAGEVRDGDHVRVDFDRDRGELTFNTVALLPEIPSLA